ncbi:MAG: hypothetical protein JWO04_3512 [Gammaproteobacteria bacterium]|nr:hypothetical protein [Gammaproteobacteria bacterium]
MGEAVERLTRLVEAEDRYNIPFADLRGAQIGAMNERFQERKGQIKLVGHRAREAGITEVRSHEDVVKLLLPHTAYKSYPENWLRAKRWDRLSKWLDTVSTHRVPVDSVSDAVEVDGWIDKLADNGFFVSCSSGTTGKSAMLVASQKDMNWCKKEAVAAYSWGSGVKPVQDRRMFGMAAVAHVARNLATGEAYTAALQDPNYERFAYPVPPITVGGLTQMVVMRKAIADGTAKPGDIAAFEQISAARQKAVDDAVGITAQAVVAARHSKIHVTGLWAGLYNVAKAVREMGYSAQDFHPENSIYVGGGLKRAKLPDDYREFVYETFNIRPERSYQNYSMQELHSGMPRCRQGGRYHVPPWVVPLILDKAGDNLLPMIDGEYEGRAAFFDLSLDGRWGGVISGDKISIDFRPCACGSEGASIRDNIVRYADLEGDDKIGCAGTVDAYVRGVA